MKPALLDTNILTAFLKGQAGVVAQMEKHLDEVGQPSISIITYYELLRGLKELGNPRRLEAFDDLIPFNGRPSGASKPDAIPVLGEGGVSDLLTSFRSPNYNPTSLSLQTHLMVRRLP